MASKGLIYSSRMYCANILGLFCSQLPVPASPLVLIMAAPSAILRSASPRLRAPQTNGILNTVLSMWFSSSAGVSTGGRGGR